MAMSNSIFGSATLKYDDVISFILSKKRYSKYLGGSTLGSSLNAQRRGKTTKRGNNSENHGKIRGKSKGKRSQSRGSGDC